MSQPKSPRLTAPQVRARKGKEKILGLTAHRAPMATLLDPFVDLMLAEDSLGMGCAPGWPRHSRGGHVGLRPQAANLDGGFKAKGPSTEAREDALAEARAVDQAGAFAMVVGGGSGGLAEEITRSIPTVGIGASPGCDWQILVTDDMIGMFEWTPKFVRCYGKVRDLIAQAVEAYAADARKGAFPVPAEMYRFASAPAAQRT